MMKRNIIREIEPEACDFSYYFDDDGLKETSGDFNNTLIIVGDRRSGGYNMDVYNSMLDYANELIENFADIGTYYGNYKSLGAMLLDFGLISDIHNTKRIKAFKDFLEDDSRSDIETVVEYLTLTTGKTWEIGSATGYSQGDYVEMIYCKERYTDGVRHYGEVWLGAAKEFCVIYLDDDGEEADAVYGYIVADSLVKTDEDYKKLVCEWAGIDPEETELQLIDYNSRTYSHYKYVAV